jgi:hypothetical protein
MPLAMQPRALWRLPPPASNSPCTPGEAASERATRENLFHLFLQAEPTRESRRAPSRCYFPDSRRPKETA